MKHKIIFTVVLSITLFFSTLLTTPVLSSQKKIQIIQTQETLMPCNDPVDTWDDEFL